jgi:hypothetical protein
MIGYLVFVILIFIGLFSLIFNTLPKTQEQVKLFQTGFRTLEINKIMMNVQTTAGTLDVLAKIDSFTAYTGNESLYSHASAIGNLKTGVTDTSPEGFIHWMNENIMMQSCLVFKNWASGIKPTFDPTLATQAALCWYYDDMLAGLKGEFMPSKDETGATVTTVANAIKGINWKDDGASTDDMHWTKLRTEFYSYGLKWKKEFPKMSARIEHLTQQKAILYQWVLFMLAKAGIIIFMKYIMAQGQSAHTIMKMGVVAGSLTEEKFGDFGFDPKVDRIIEQYVRTGKKEEITGSTGLDNLIPYNGTPINEKFMETTDLNNVLFDIKTEFNCVPKESLHFARVNFGMGNYKESKVFINLLLGLIPNAANSLNHGKFEYVVGAETSLHLQIMRNLKKIDLPGLIDEAIQKQEHFHFKDLKPIFADFFVRYTFTKSLQGYANPEAYLGSKSMFRFTTITASSDDVYMNTEVVSDPNALHTTSTLETTVAKFLNQSAALIALGSYIPSYYKLFFPNGADRTKLYHYLVWSNMLSLTSSTSWQTNRYTLYKESYVEVIDARSLEDKIYGICTDDAEQTRWEYRLDPVAIGTLKYVALKYNCGLVASLNITERNISESRPRGHEDEVYLENIGEKEELQGLALLLVSAPSDKFGDQSVKTEVIPTSDPKPNDLKPEEINKETDEEESE